MRMGREYDALQMYFLLPVEGLRDSETKHLLRASVAHTWRTPTQLSCGLIPLNHVPLGFLSFSLKPGSGRADKGAQKAPAVPAQTAGG